MSAVDQWATVWAAAAPPPAAPSIRAIFDEAVRRGQWGECAAGLLRHALAAPPPPGSAEDRARLAAAWAKSGRPETMCVACGGLRGPHEPPCTCLRDAREQADAR